MCDLISDGVPYAFIISIALTWIVVVICGVIAVGYTLGYFLSKYFNWLKRNLER